MSTTCALRAAVGDDAMREAETATTRAIHNGPDRAVDCPLSHAGVEHLIARGHLVTEAQARRRAEVAAANNRSDVEGAEQRRDRAVAGGREAGRQLAAVLALVNVRRRTVAMDDLRRALGLLAEELSDAAR